MDEEGEGCSSSSCGKDQGCEEESILGDFPRGVACLIQIQTDETLWRSHSNKTRRGGEEKCVPQKKELSLSFNFFSADIFLKIFDDRFVDFM